MSKSKIPQVLGYNLLILAVYTLASGLANRSEYDYPIFMMMAIALHVAVNVITAIVFFIRKRSDLGGAFLLSAGLVLVVGFSLCMGGAQMF